MGERRTDGGSHWTDDGEQHLAEVRGTLRGAAEGAGPGGTGRGSGRGRRRTGALRGNSQRSPGTSNVQQQNSIKHGAGLVTANQAMKCT